MQPRTTSGKWQNSAKPSLTNFLIRVMRCLWPWSWAARTGIAQALHGARRTTCFWPWSGVVYCPTPWCQKQARPDDTYCTSECRAKCGFQSCQSHFFSHPPTWTHPVRILKVSQLNFWPTLFVCRKFPTKFPLVNNKLKQHVYFQRRILQNVLCCESFEIFRRTAQ